MTSNWYKGNDFYFQKITNPKITLNIVENIALQKQQREVIGIEVNTPLAETQSLIRVTLALDKTIGKISANTNSLLIMVLHHAIADGVCSMELQHEVLQSYAKLRVAKRKPHIQTLPVMPSLEKLVAKNFKPYGLQKFIQQYQIKTSNYADAYCLPLNLLANSQQTPLIVLIQDTFSCAATKKLLHKCKQHKTTLHSTIAAAALLAIRQQFKNLGNKPIKLCCHSPVDVRSRLSPAISHEHMFMAVAGSVGCFKVSNINSIWNLSREIATALHNDIKSNDVLKTVLTFAQTEQQAMSNITIGISTLGKINLPQFYDTVKVTTRNGVGFGLFPIITATSLIFGDKLILNWLFK